ncbi:hypothetical protein [Desulforamulus aquiferis]|uniref:HEPN domain-containing protein n=1 Tax=Desulforamulus aquiferis TaxID=1397668 RepID=A0AAW7ZF61_9FIRM|nr:hypothetical protein [Desulforamulus aquiferis]MDO7787897.1 hypothetical protein [Desulforamulus aquiferis]
MQKLNQALASLNEALLESGERTDVAINYHRLAPLQCLLLAREIIMSGFGTKVIEDNKLRRYSHKPGAFSWITIQQDNIKICLFYDFKYLI